MNQVNFKWMEQLMLWTIFGRSRTTSLPIWWMLWWVCRNGQNWTNVKGCWAITWKEVQSSHSYRTHMLKARWIGILLTNSAWRDTTRQFWSTAEVNLLVFKRAVVSSPPGFPLWGSTPTQWHYIRINPTRIKRISINQPGLSGVQPGFWNTQIVVEQRSHMLKCV